MQLVRKFPTFYGYFYQIQMLYPNLSKLNLIQNCTPYYLTVWRLMTHIWVVPHR